MGQAIPTQHPAVVLRSHYTHLRILLAIAMIAVFGLTHRSGDPRRRRRPRHERDPRRRHPQRIGRHGARRAAAGGAPGADLRVAAPPTGRRYDGGPEEGTRGIVAQPRTTRHDGGPDEGSRGPGR